MIEAGRFTVAPGHPALPGHFPGNPVTPGVVLLDYAMEAILAAHPGHRLAALPSVKFLRPIRAGDTISVAFQPGPSRIAFSCHLGSEEVLRGTLVLHPVA